MRNFFKILLIIIIAFVVIIYGSVFLGHKVFFQEPTSDVPTIQDVTGDMLTLGVQSRSSQPTAISDYISLLAVQVSRYNEIAPDLWPNNTLVNQSVIVEETGKAEFWLIAPDGTVTPLSKNEALGYGFYRNPYFGGFDFSDGVVYLAVAEKDLTNYLLFQKYLHLGTYDAFITFVHEGFHVKEQADWQQMNNIPNIGRDEFLENTAARAKRTLLQRQLLKAVSEPGNTQLVLDALATYEDYKTQFPEDYKNSVFTDRIEGTAYYYELISCLYSSYPEQIKNKSDLERALALLATREDIYVDYGLVVEGYHIGGFSCVLLDRFKNDWKERIKSDPEATPIEMLYQHFNEETLPAPKQLTQTEIDAVGAEIQKKSEGAGSFLLFRFLYEILF